MSGLYFAESKPGEARSVVFAEGEDAVSILSHMRSESRGWGKSVIALESDSDAEWLEVTDALCMVSSFLILNSRAQQVMAPVDRSGAIEWIPAQYCGQQWWAAHVWGVVNAVNEEQSVFRRAASGKVMAVDRLILNASRVPNRCAFRLGNGLETFAPVVTAAFRETWLSSGLSGLSFLPIASQ
jgi:hypothetical protein